MNQNDVCGLKQPGGTKVNSIEAQKDRAGVILFQTILKKQGLVFNIARLLIEWI